MASTRAMRNDGLAWPSLKLSLTGVIRYWLASSIPVSVQEVASTVQGKVTAPGELRTITNEEVSALEVILVESQIY